MAVQIVADSPCDNPHHAELFHARSLRRPRARAGLGPDAAGTGSADARLRALYTEEWNWRQQELARAPTAFPESMPRRNRRGSPTGRER